MRKHILQQRASEEELKVLKQAAALQGLRLNCFTRSAAIEKARNIIQKNQEFQSA